MQIEERKARNSHKGIIIGKNGEMLKRIGRMARIDMEENFGVKVNLKTWVKVASNKYVCQLFAKKIIPERKSIWKKILELKLI